MAKQRSPDGRLVYLHCSSIFSGANAQIRRAKKVSQILEKHRASIKILTKEFTLPAIAAVAKELLEEQVFESLPRAKLRYPELFQSSETQEAERAASEAEVIRIEAEAAQDIVLTYEDEGGDECLDFEQSEPRPEPEETLEDKADAEDNVHISTTQMCQQSTSRAQQALSIPRLHPVYLPFKTQHRILVPVQTLLEECCLEFGNIWVPDLMEARKWNEAESIELTEWTKRFSKYVKSLPSSAIKLVPGKSIAEVLFGTSTLRHSAVHRLPTSAAGILNMLSAAITFAEALNNPKRAEKVAEIKTQLEASIEEIVQHQNLLKRKLTEQFEDIARRRAELDELERSSIEEMLAMDKEQRTEVGSALEDFLVDSQQTSNPCTCSQTPSFDGAKVDSKAEENIECSSIEDELKPPAGMNEAQAYDQSPLGEEEPDQGEGLGKDDRPPCHDSSGGSIEEEPDASWKEAAASAWGNFAAEEVHALVDEAPTSEDAFAAPAHVVHDIDCEWPQKKEVWNFGATSDVPADPYFAAEETTPLAPKGAFPDEKPYTKEPEEEPLVEDACPVEEAISTDEPMGMEKDAPEPTLEASQPALIFEGFDDVEERPPNQYCNVSHHSGDPCETMSEPDAAPIHVDPGFHSPPPSATSSTVTSVLEAAAEEAPTKDSHTITLKILNGSKVLRSIVFIRACTRTAILNEARAYCVKRAQDDQNMGRLLAEGWDLTLVSLTMYGYDMDLSTYRVENLSSLVRTASKTGIPSFTLRISGI